MVSADIVKIKREVNEREIWRRSQSFSEYERADEGQSIFGTEVDEFHKNLQAENAEEDRLIRAVRKNAENYRSNISGKTTAVRWSALTN
ncbi:hypothetical protein THIOM_001808 [Candidatus Thiomargarita nelsonii]|uniref:Uncharacterized protein n=1 Tax=Candidatus Thiomargarita nelsonii TaxID=1003181 RepID=A0A176S3C3_9GAMM|nr:hypothetical protein THIOM_001808 [Candidatus Thiomargarita nelsonii]